MSSSNIAQRFAEIFVQSAGNRKNAPVPQTSERRGKKGGFPHLLII